MPPDPHDAPEPGGGSSAAAGKAELRVRMRAVRASIPEAERARLAGLIEAHAAAHLGRAEARTVLLFYAFGSEVPTAGIVARLHRAGARVLLPYLTGSVMEAAEVLPGEPLDPTTYGPREPSRRVAIDPLDLDAIVVPGLAFDRALHRLGYGGGHYDRYLARVQPDALRMGIAFSAQIVERIPSEPSDQPVHVVVTEDGPFSGRP